MDNKKFINTSDAETAETLRNLGFKELPQSGKFWVFINQDKISFTNRDLKVSYTDKLFF